MAATNKISKYRLDLVGVWDVRWNNEGNELAY
jgi:hypothetical protein